MTIETVLEAEDLTRHFGTRLAVDGIHFRLSRGEVLGLLGANGAGKTTCLDMLGGVLGSTRGRVWVCGLDLDEVPEAAKRRLGYLPEQPPLYPEMRVGEYLTFAARLRGLGRYQAVPAVAAAMARCGLGGMERRRLGQLSKGYRQRVGIAQAIVHTPALVILDEPTSGLDPLQSAEFIGLIQTLAQSAGVIFSTHRLAEASALCHRVLILQGGRLAGEWLAGSPEGLASAFATAQTPPEAIT
ncbi:MAG: ABC transporter ATP-binding protein [Pseudomonadota bacterium]